VLKPSISFDEPWDLLNRKSTCPMPDATSTEAYARRWQALHAKSSTLQKEHTDLMASWTPPFSVKQTAQLASRAARRDDVSERLSKLVDEWAADARSR
jgi:hypothetical protein